MFLPQSLVGARAPELSGGVEWFNSGPVEIYKLKNKIVLVDFWTYSCVNCIRTLPHLVAWHREYAKDGLVIIGVHTPEFEFEKKSENIKRALVDFGILYPVVSDANYVIWHAFANHVWPRKFLIDRNFRIQYDHAGEGNYEETEGFIRRLLLEINPDLKFAKIVSVDHHHALTGGAVCFPQSPETYFGYSRGVIGNIDGFVKDQFYEYKSDKPIEGKFYLLGTWKATAEYVESGAGSSSCEMVVKGVEVNLVAQSQEMDRVDIEFKGRPIERSMLGADVKVLGGKSYLEILKPRMYRLIKSRDFLNGNLRLITKTRGIRFFSFTFGGCI